MIALYLAGGSIVAGVAVLVGLQARWDRKAKIKPYRVPSHVPTAPPVPPPPVWIARLPSQTEDGRWWAVAECSHGGAVETVSHDGYSTRRAAIVGAERLAARLNRGEAA